MIFLLLLLLLSSTQISIGNYGQFSVCGQTVWYSGCILLITFKDINWVYVVLIPIIVYCPTKQYVVVGQF
jgi:hypothetical protein